MHLMKTLTLEKLLSQNWVQAGWVGPLGIGEEPVGWESPKAQKKKKKLFLLHQHIQHIKSYSNLLQVLFTIIHQYIIH